MGGLTSKRFKLQKKETTESEEEKHASVTGVEYRDKAFKFSRETKSAYYYGHKVENGTGVDKSDDGTVQKKVVLQKGGSSDHTLFRRVRETPTAIYYEPNDDPNDPDMVEEGDKKNIVLENPPPDVEPRLKVIRDGSGSDIKIRPESVTIQKHDMIIDTKPNRKPRDDILNTYSVMVKDKERNAIPTATVTLDEDRGLGAIAEGKERESQLLAEEQEQEAVQVEESVSKQEKDKQETDAEAEKQKEPNVPFSTEEPGTSQKVSVSSEKEPTEAKTETDNNVTKHEESSKERTIPDIKIDEAPTVEPVSEDAEPVPQETVETKEAVATGNTDAGETKTSADEAVRATEQVETSTNDHNESSSVKPKDDLTDNNTTDVQSETITVQETVVHSSENINDNITSTDSQTAETKQDSVNESVQQVLPVVTNHEDANNPSHANAVDTKLEHGETHISNEATANAGIVTESTTKLAKEGDEPDKLETEEIEKTVVTSTSQVNSETSELESDNL